MGTRGNELKRLQALRGRSAQAGAPQHSRRKTSQGQAGDI